MRETYEEPRPSFANDVEPEPRRTGGKRGISVEEAVYAYTLGAAYAEFQEKEKGSIEVGKLADLVIISSDLFADKADIRSAKIVQTVVNGWIVYENR